MSRPRFSILMPSYNQAGYQIAALDSLLAQTMGDWEALVVNDGSTDGTPDLIESYGRRDPRFRVFHKTNGGTASALNEGLRHATGEWILWLSADDLFEADKLQRHAEECARQPEACFFHTDFAMLEDATGTVTRDASPIRTSVPVPPWHIVSMFQFNYIDGITVCLHRGLVAKVGDFRSLYGYAQDVDFWLRAALHAPPVFIPATTAVTRVHPGQGYFQNPERCFLDAARACADLLNSVPFPALFPGLDWRDDAQVGEALERVFDLLCNTGSFVWLGGLERLLLPRLREWLASGDNARHRRRVLDLCNRLVEQAPTGSPQLRCKEFADRLLDPAPAEPFHPIDPFMVLAMHGATLRERGHTPAAARMAAYLRQYGRSSKEAAL